MASTRSGDDVVQDRWGVPLRAASQQASSNSTMREYEAIADLCGRLDAGLVRSGWTVELLEPIASFVGAEKASLRLRKHSPGFALPRAIATVGIPASVGDAYRERFHKFDPARRLLRPNARGPLFADPDRPGQWLDVSLSPAARRQLLNEFAEYRLAFLEPHDLVQHTGFCIHDDSGQTLFFDFHRGRRARPFGRIEVARARVVAHYLYARIAARRKRVLAPAPDVAFADALSSRESEVVAAVAEGLSNKEVACALGISVRTVENHMRAVFAKLKLSSRTQLLAALHRSPDNQGADALEW